MKITTATPGGIPPTPQGIYTMFGVCPFTQTMEIEWKWIDAGHLLEQKYSTGLTGKLAESEWSEVPQTGEFDLWVHLHASVTFLTECPLAAFTWGDAHLAAKFSKLEPLYLVTVKPVHFCVKCIRSEPRASMSLCPRFPFHIHSFVFRRISLGGNGVLKHSFFCVFCFLDLMEKK